MNKHFILFLFYTASLLAQDFPEFGERINNGEVENNEINEASGIVSSKINSNVLWVHNDSGNKNKLFAVNREGLNIGEYTILGSENRDWEDIAIGPGSDFSLNNIYIGDIGDNSSQYEVKYIYCVKEPFVLPEFFNIKDTLSVENTIEFVYPDGPRDAEALFIDPNTGDIYIIGKRDSEIRLYRLAYPQSFTNQITAELVGTFSLPIDVEMNKPYNYITGADISSDGTEILLKTYSTIYYWEIKNDRSISETILNDIPFELPFENSVDEAQGEAICWNNWDNRGYFTISEEKIFVNNIEFNFPAQLYYYPRITPVDINNTVLENGFYLSQNFPNPFNPNTVIEYSVPKLLNQVHVKLKIFDAIGHEINTLVDEVKKSGTYSLELDTFTYFKNLSSGVYYYQIQVGNYRETKKMVLMK